VGLQLNTVLVNTGDKLVLIDAGGGIDGKSRKPPAPCVVTSSPRATRRAIST
jgi:hypothetical protein